MIDHFGFDQLKQNLNSTISIWNLRKIHLRDLHQGKLSQSQGELSRDQADLRQRQGELQLQGKLLKLRLLITFNHL